MDIKKGELYISINGKHEQSIIDFICDGYVISVFQGTISTHDIII